MDAYYNEFDPDAAAWLRELIRNGLIADGEVDERDIQDIDPHELRGFRQCHFFAGIGGWSYALRMAGWPDDTPVWTGSCPCQPYSTAGQRKGHADERHLWPAWFHLISECGPDTVFGEQVESAIGHGWLDLVYDDMEGEGYRVGSAVLPAASVGAPHLRHRLFFVADREREGLEIVREQSSWHQCQPIERSGEAGGVGFTDCTRSLAGMQSTEAARYGYSIISTGGDGFMVVSTSEQMGISGFTWLGRAPNWIYCGDKKWRPIEPGTLPMAHGIPARVGRLRGYGNAIVPQVTAAFIRAYIG